ncbi:sodium:solute symporter [Acidisoma cellulosilytica]|uniref:Sodium:solute symporter n=1 Tax=Acidisoma cellulosilyticum TaxID=2802395 RepID=A0A964E3V5_9PROT|nr:sodium:solute symporter [Acidisoma cellulosilyticum]MCB8880338.1 sodium:solute symporter [Acidisoma cellulosilyticum]
MTPLALQPVALAVFLALFVFVTVLGFLAARWRRGDLDTLHEWGLGGRRFGTWISWFLLGGDLYTAYTFVAVPALVFGAGAVGFFAVPYTIIIYPILFAFFPRLWRVCKRHGYLTAPEFVRGRFESRSLSVALALTGILATMPYIALQLVGMQVVLAALGLQGSGIWADMPLFIAFVVLAAFTYTSGLRAPAIIAVVKDLLIYATVIAAAIVIPMHLGGWSKIFAAVPAAKLTLPVPGPHSLGSYGAYATLALGSALALFLYPHSMTGILAASSGRVIKRNAALLPAYSLVLGLLALLGFMAIAYGVAKNPAYAAGFAQYKGNFAVPALILSAFPSWFAGIAFAAIAIGALVPASIMSIATANIFTRDIYKAFIKPHATDAQESGMAKLVSLIVKLGALAFIVILPATTAIQFQLLGGIWIIQTLPAVMLGLSKLRLRPAALLTGWAAGMVIGTAMAASTAFKSAIFPLHLPGGFLAPGYAALYALIANLAISLVLSWILNAFRSEAAARNDPAARFEF